ncbi:MAG TPA: sugar-transfer associated ATP-grasp domain-containing protein [Pseudogracilibacillus sp.]|nr:sugar-transfer associated ATP-grasp domain-containing protein [Pseudogracilibacillus sp.]
MGFLRNMLTNYVSFKYLINEEKVSDSNLNVLKKLNLLMHGFSSEKYDLYNFAKNNQKGYLSDFQRRKTYRINNKYAIIINDKNVFEKLLENDNITATNYGHISNGEIYINRKHSDFEKLVEIIKEKGQLIIKKTIGGGGKGIYKIAFSDDTFYIDDEDHSLEKLKAFIYNLKNHIIQEYISQADYSYNIYQGTINSIRILTMRDPETNEAFIATAVHKFGSEKTKPADNVWKGGMTALVNLETGVLQRSAYHHKDNKKIEWKDTHPDTCVKIEGTVIPNWEQVKDKVINLMNELSYLNYVGWDVVVTNDGVKVIEGNNYSDVNILQIHAPLLVNDRVKKFYKHYGIIK